MNDPENEGRLARWSRRKRRARDAGDDAVAEEPITPPIDTADGDDDADLSEEELLEKYELPDPETLKVGDDFSAFMRQGVPDILRRKALRVLWKSNPALANLDGLIDYGEDFTDAAVVPETIATVYQVGKGIVRDVLAPDTAPPDVAAHANVTSADEIREDVPSEHSQATADKTVETTEPTIDDPAQPEPEPTEFAMTPETAEAGKPRTRRMKFSN